MKKTKDQLGQERAARWRRFGVLGQYAYAKAMFYKISTDEKIPHDLRRQSMFLAEETRQLVNKYKEYLK